MYDPSPFTFLTAAQIASPTATMLGDIKRIYILKAAPYTMYLSNGTTLNSFNQSSNVDYSAGRTQPAGLPTLPFTLLSVGGGVGKVVTNYNNNAIQAALAQNSSIVNSGILYLKPSTGSDGNAGTSASAPLATLTQAMRTLTTGSRIVCLEDCVIPAGQDLRSTDASQATEQFKWLDANGYKVIMRIPGVDLSVVTWAQDATNTNCYKCDLSAAGLNANSSVTRVLRSDVLDAYGFEKQFASYTSAALLNSSSAVQGFFWDNTGRILWLNMANGNVENKKSVLRGLFLDTAGNGRVQSTSAKIGFSGVRFEGLQFTHEDTGGSSRRSQTWLHNCLQLWSHDKGSNLDYAGDFIATNTMIYASKGDGINAFQASANTGKGLIFTINCKIIRSGDQSVYAADGTIQGISAHGGSHHVSWGTECFENNGQQIGDVCVNGSTNDITWLVACSTKPYTPAIGTYGNYFFGSGGTTGSRVAYLDTCFSTTPTTVDLYTDTTATVYTYNTSVPLQTGTAPTAYTPTFT